MGNQLRSQCPDSKRPYLIYRLSSPNVQKEYWGLLLEQFKQYKNAFDEVWFSTGTGVPSLEKHRELSHLAAECAEDIRKLGWQPGRQIQATLGHSDAGTATTEGKNWGGYVGRTTCLRYLEKITDEVKITTSLTFATLPGYDAAHTETALMLDVYEPSDDTEKIVTRFYSFTAADLLTERET